MPHGPFTPEVNAAYEGDPAGTIVDALKQNAVYEALANTYTVAEINAALALLASAAELTAHTGNTANPHAVTKAQVGLANVDNTSDLGKPVSTAQQAALDAKAGVGHTHTQAQVQAALAGMPFDPATMTYDYDDFVSGNVSFGQVGKLGWSTSNLTISFATTEAGRPGIIRATTPATANSIAFLRGTGAGVGPYRLVDFYDCTWIIRPGAVDAETIMRVGVGWTSQQPPGHGVYFERLATDTNWHRVTRHVGMQTRTDTGVPFAVAWTKLRVRRLSTTEMGFTINGGTEFVHATNAPNYPEGAPASVGIIPTAASAKFVDIDWFSCLVTGLNREETA